MPAKLSLAFLAGSKPPDYLQRLARLRWCRAASSAQTMEITEQALAREVFASAESWIVVCDETALPVPGEIPEPEVGRVLLACAGVPVDPLNLHTLREFEAARFRAAEPLEQAGGCLALAFRAADFPPAPAETVGAFVRRLSAPPTDRRFDPRFRAFVFEEASERERSEVTRHLPEGRLRVLDVGCGAGGASGAAKQKNPFWIITGIEKDARLASRARARLDRVLEGDAREILPRLAASGEKYDTFLFADILEHLEDPIHALALARELATPRATLVASVPNVGHLSLVRDLLLGRFDPIPAGLADVGHLRWFTRSSLAEALEEAGWRGISIESTAGAPAPQAEEFLTWLSGWPELDRESLATYQWIAVAAAE